MAVVGQLFCMRTLKNRAGIALVLGYGNKYIDLIVFDKIVNGLVKIIHTYKVKLGPVFFKHLLQPGLPVLVFFCDSYIMIWIHVHNMKYGIEHFQYGID